ncbi:MAG: RNA polymerase sigma-70 factor [Saprospiraceae bacterium]
MNSQKETQEILDWEELMKGSQQALRSLFERYYPILVQDLRRYLADEDQCRDLAQDVFVDIWNKRKQLQVQTSVEAYLRRAARNKALNFLKQNQRMQLEDSSTWYDVEDQGQHERQLLEHKESLESALHEAIDALPEKCRVVFVLSRFENMSHKEIAEQLDISPKTIENQITKAMKLLRASLAGFGDLSPIIIWWLFSIVGA